MLHVLDHFSAVSRPGSSQRPHSTFCMHSSPSIQVWLVQEIFPMRGRLHHNCLSSKTLPDSLLGSGSKSDSEHDLLKVIRTSVFPAIKIAEPEYYQPSSTAVRDSQSSDMDPPLMQKTNCEAQNATLGRNWNESRPAQQSCRLHCDLVTHLFLKVKAMKCLVTIHLR